MSMGVPAGPKLMPVATRKGGERRQRPTRAHKHAPAMTTCWYPCVSAWSDPGPVKVAVVGGA